MFALGPGRNIVESPAKTMFEPIRKATASPRSRRNSVGFDHLPPIKVLTLTPPRRAPHTAIPASSHSQAIVIRYEVARGDSPNCGRPRRYALQAARPARANKKSTVCQTGAMSLGWDGSGCVIAAAFIEERLWMVGRRSGAEESKAAAQGQPLLHMQLQVRRL